MQWRKKPKNVAFVHSGSNGERAINNYRERRNLLQPALKKSTIKHILDTECVYNERKLNAYKIEVVNGGEKWKSSIMKSVKRNKYVAAAINSENEENEMLALGNWREAFDKL